MAQRRRARGRRDDEMRQLVASCRTHAFSDLVRARVADRRVSIGHVLECYGWSGLLAIADDVSAALDQLTPTKKAYGVVGAEVGVLLGLVVGLIASGARPREYVDRETVH